jgi:hypothetical protein
MTDESVVVRTCSVCGVKTAIAASTESAAEHVSYLDARITDLEQQLGILHESDGREARLGVTAERLSVLRTLAEAKSSDELTNIVLAGLRDALRFYDLVRKAWEGTREDYNDLALERDILKAQLREYEPSDGVMHQRLALYTAIEDAAGLLDAIERESGFVESLRERMRNWLALPAVVQARKAMMR